MSDCYGSCQRGEACDQCGYGTQTKEDSVRKKRNARPADFVERAEEWARANLALKAQVRALKRRHARLKVGILNAIAAALLSADAYNTVRWLRSALATDAKAAKKGTKR